jgi:arylsulfatase A-like enzyme
MIGLTGKLGRPLAAIWLVGSLIACGTPQESPSVILISIDTLRADALEVYGYERSTSPTLSRFATESFVFQNAYTQSANTMVSHASMLTGLYPSSHATAPNRPLAEDHTTIAEVLKSVGYRTAGFTTHADWLTREEGFAQGFNRFESKYRDASANTTAVLDWLDSWTTRLLALQGAPLFLFLHYYDVHSDWKDVPYESASRFAGFYSDKAVPDFDGCRNEVCASQLLRRSNVDLDLLSQAEVEWTRALYDAGVADMDAELGELFDALDERGLLDTSWVVVTSDHGEEFREHGRMLHSQAYRETARVPLIIRPPGGIERTNIETPAGLVDLVPTLLAIVDVPTKTQTEGESLLPVMNGAPATERMLGFDFYHLPAYFAVRNDRFSLISHNPDESVELYDFVADPDETEDVATRYPEMVERLRAKVTAIRGLGMAASGDPLPAREQSDGEEDRLRALGYID